MSKAIKSSRINIKAYRTNNKGKIESFTFINVNTTFTEALLQFDNIKDRWRPVYRYLFKDKNLYKKEDIVGYIKVNGDSYKNNSNKRCIDINFKVSEEGAKTVIENLIDYFEEDKKYSFKRLKNNAILIKGYRLVFVEREAESNVRV